MTNDNNTQTTMDMASCQRTASLGSQGSNIGRTIQINLNQQHHGGHNDCLDSSWKTDLSSSWRDHDADDCDDNDDVDTPVTSTSSSDAYGNEDYDDDIHDEDNEEEQQEEYHHLNFTGKETMSPVIFDRGESTMYSSSLSNKPMMPLGSSMNKLISRPSEGWKNKQLEDNNEINYNNAPLASNNFSSMGGGMGSMKRITSMSSFCTAFNEDYGTDSSDDDEDDDDINANANAEADRTNNILAVKASEAAAAFQTKNIIEPRESRGVDNTSNSSHFETDDFEFKSFHTTAKPNTTTTNESSSSSRPTSSEVSLTANSERQRRPNRGLARATSERQLAGGSTTNNSGNELRKSTLVSNDSSLDVSWFASQGLMSRRSFERYKKEMKSKVLTGASGAGNHDDSLEDMIGGEVDMTRVMGGRGGVGRVPRRSSIGASVNDMRRSMPVSMGMMMNEVNLELDDPLSPLSPIPFLKNTKAAAGLPPPPLFKNVKENSSFRLLSTKKKVCKSRSMDDGLDQMLTTFISSFNKGSSNGGGQFANIKNASLKLVSHPEAKDTNETIANNNTKNKADIKSCLSSDEIRVFKKMMRRLSNEGDGSDKDDMDNDDGDDPAKNNGLDGRQPINEEVLQDTIETGAASQPIAEQAKSSTKTSGHINENSSNEDIKEAESATSNTSSNVAKLLKKHRLLSRRKSSDSMPRPMFERNDTFGSAVMYTPHEEKTSMPNAMMEGLLQSFSPLQAVPSIQVPKFERSDTFSTMSPNPTSLMTTSLERGDTQSTMSTVLDTPTLNRQSTIDTACAVSTMPSQGLCRDDSDMTDAMPPQEGRLSFVIDTEDDEMHTDFKEKSIIGAEVAMSRVKRISGLDDDVLAVSAKNDISKSVSDGTPVRRFSNTELLSDTNSTGNSTRTPLEGPPPKEDCGDIFEEGMEYLSMAMLVNIYGKLREMSTLGHASVKFVDVDVNSHQSISRANEMKRLGLLKPEDESKGYLENTKTAGFVVRAVLDEYEMFEASSEMCALSQAKQANMAYDASLLSEFKTWVEESRTKQLDSITEGVIQKLRDECSKRQTVMEKRALSASTNSLQAELGRSVARRRNSLIMKSDSFQDATWLKQEQALIADHFGIKNGVPNSTSECNVRRASQKISNGVLTESMITKTIKESSDYFEKGSVMRNLIEAGFEVTWFSDRHPDDITYCICVNRQTNTVTVIFRGREGFFDLCKNTSMTKYPNPICHEDYDGNSEFIKLRSAVSDEMMRIRRDTKKSTIDEIREKVDAIGLELVNGGRYHLSVTGHSLGGGLATLLGYYLASDPRLDLASAVRIFTFSSPRVGCKNFQRGFRHLEETGRLMHARFTNSNDVASFLPMWALDENNKIDDWYMHVGLQIRLHSSSKAGRQRTRQALDVSYSRSISFMDEVVDLLMNCLAALKMMSFGWKSSSISEYQHRMHFAREYRLALGGGVLRFDKKRKHLKSLTDYYLMKCRSVAEFADDTKRSDSMPSFLVFFLVSCLISFEVALLFRFISTW